MYDDFIPSFIILYMEKSMTEIIVVKLGGTQGLDFSAICSDAVELLKKGRILVFVHGGSARQLRWDKGWARHQR